MSGMMDPIREAEIRARREYALEPPPGIAAIVYEDSDVQQLVESDILYLLGEIERLRGAMRSAIAPLDALSAERTRGNGEVVVTLATVTGTIADELRHALEVMR